MTDTIDDDAPFFAWLELQREIVELQLQEDGDVELPVTANHLSDFMFYYDRRQRELETLRAERDELKQRFEIKIGELYAAEIERDKARDEVDNKNEEIDSLERKHRDDREAWADLRRQLKRKAETGFIEHRAVYASIEEAIRMHAQKGLSFTQIFGMTASQTTEPTEGE